MCFSLILNDVICTCALMDHRREGRSEECVLGVGSSVTSKCLQGENHKAQLSAAGDSPTVRMQIPPAWNNISVSQSSPVTEIQNRKHLLI